MSNLGFSRMSHSGFDGDFDARVQEALVEAIRRCAGDGTPVDEPVEGAHACGELSRPRCGARSGLVRAPTRPTAPS